MNKKFTAILLLFSLCYPPFVSADTVTKAVAAYMVYKHIKEKKE